MRVGDKNGNRKKVRGKTRIGGRNKDWRYERELEARAKIIGRKEHRAMTRPKAERTWETCIGRLYPIRLLLMARLKIEHPFSAVPMAFIGQAGTTEDFSTVLKS